LLFDSILFCMPAIRLYVVTLLEELRSGKTNHGAIDTEICVVLLPTEELYLGERHFQGCICLSVIRVGRAIYTYSHIHIKHIYINSLMLLIEIVSSVNRGWNCCCRSFTICLSMWRSVQATYYLDANCDINANSL
jgi:hypothetical protein